MPASPLPGKTVLGKYSPCRVVDLGAVKLVFLSGLTSAGEAPRDTKAHKSCSTRWPSCWAPKAGGLSTW